MHKLATYLADHDLTQSAFAELIGSTQVSVSRWISGQRMPRPAMIALIKTVTRGAVTADDFMGSEEDDEEAAPDREAAA